MRGQNKIRVRRNDKEGSAGYPTLNGIEIVNDLSNYYWKPELSLTLGQSTTSESELMSKSDGDQNRSKVRLRLVSTVVKVDQSCQGWFKLVKIYQG